MLSRSRAAAVERLRLRMRHWREARGYSVRAMAEACHFGKSTVSDIELGKCELRREAVEAYQRVLNVPGGELVEAFDRLALLAEASAPGPAASLPPAVAGFTGRKAELSELLSLAHKALEDERPTLVFITGPGGIGKTTLAVQAARASSGFWIAAFLDLAEAGRPVDPAAALHRLLSHLGVLDQDIPADPSSRSNLLHRMLEGSTPLLVLDDASAAGQIAPLLPGGPALVLVTCRKRLWSPVGGHEMALRPLPRTDAERLTRHLIGGDRCDAEPSATSVLVDACGGVPLALRIAARRVRSAPQWPIAEYAARLTDERSRLAALQAGDLRIDAVYDLSYQALSQEARVLFRRLPLVPGGRFGEGGAAQLSGLGPQEAAERLWELFEANLIEHDTDPGRYRVHDLLRLFAESRFRSEEPPQSRTGAAAGLTRWLLETATTAGEALRHDPQSYPGGVQAALAWLDRESGAVLAMLERASAEGGPSLGPASTARLIDAMSWYGDYRCRWEALEAAGRHALAIARRAENPLLEAAARTAIGNACIERFRPVAATAQLRPALRAARAAGDWFFEADVLGALGVALRNQGAFDRAAEAHHAALRLCAEHGDRPAELRERARLGHVLALVGDHESAADLLGRVLVAWREEGRPRPAAMTAYRLAAVHCSAGAYATASQLAREALSGFRSVDDAWGTAAAEQALGAACAGLGDLAAAAQSLSNAANGFDLLADRFRQAQTLRELGRCHVRRGDPVAAREAWGLAAELLERIDDPNPLLTAERSAVRDLAAGAAAEPPGLI